MKNFIFISILMMFYFSVAHAADFKIGVVSVDRIMSEAPQLEVLKRVMMEKFGDKRSELQGFEKDIKTMQENYKRNELVMTEDKLNELKNKIIRNVQIFKQKEAALGKEVRVMQNQELVVIQQAIQEIVHTIAKDGGYDLILSDGVAFIKNDEFDISNEVLDKMKEKFKAEKK